MANPLPKHPQLRGNYAPVNFEAVCHDLVIEGAVPEGLTGSLYRIGPNPKFVPDQGYHWFFGAGMVHAFHVHEGQIDYLNRWVRTPKFEAELAAGTSLPMSIVVDPENRAVAIGPAQRLGEHPYYLACRSVTGAGRGESPLYFIA